MALTITPVAGLPPMVTVAPVRLVPVMVTGVPPAMGPLLGLMLVIVGSNWMTVTLAPAMLVA